MARRALLIGSQTGLLSGVGNDIASMSATLERWGFRSALCEAENASRAGILDAYDRLIADTEPGDAVVVYYSGHGGYSRPPADPTHRRTFQFIVPTDYHESTEDDFLGITSVELSLLLARLTEATKNVTVVLDCCHAAHMSRDWDLTPKALSRAVSYRLIAGHLDNLRRRGQRIDQWTAPGNPHAVRIVACAPEQSAYEFHNRAGIRTGMLTDTLTQALAEAKTADLGVSWATVIDRVRHQVLTIMPSQRPDAEGPAQRLLFDMVEADSLTSLPVALVAGRVRIGGAALLGVRPGDEFVVMPGQAAGPDDHAKIGDVRVDRVDAQAAWGQLAPIERAAAISLGARAHLVRTAAPVMPVRLAGPVELARAVDAAPLVRAAESDEDSPVVVECHDGLTVRDARGPLHAPRAADADGVREVVRDLTRLARARALRRLAEDTEDTLRTPVTIEFGLVVDGQVRPLPASGAVLHAGQAICLRVRNEGADPIHVSLLDIGVAARITVLNPSSPSGVRLESGAEYLFGGNDLTEDVPGVALSWPEDLSAAAPRQETVVVLATSAPVDTRVLEQQGVRTADARRTSKLQRWLAQLGTGGPRDLTPMLGPAVRFAVRTVDFELVPTAAPVDHGPFQVDDRPSATATLWQPRSAAPTGVALWLSDLVVHHNRAFRSQDLRLDTLVIGGGHHARTERFRDVSDGLQLPVADLLLYQGEAVDTLEVAVWVSRDSGPDLSELLPEPPAVEVAHRLLSDVSGDCIGLYRTTLLAHEGFGTGWANTVRAQDFSFRWFVESASRPSVHGWQVPALD